MLYKTGVAEDVSRVSVPNFIMESRRQQKDFRPLYVDEDRRAGLTSHSPAEHIKKFQDLGKDLDQALNKTSKP